MQLSLGRDTGALRASCGSIQQHATEDYSGTLTKSEGRKLVFFLKQEINEWTSKKPIHLLKGLRCISFSVLNLLRFRFSLCHYKDGCSASKNLVYIPVIKKMREVVEKICELFETLPLYQESNFLKTHWHNFCFRLVCERLVTRPNLAAKEPGEVCILKVHVGYTE